MKSMLHNKKSDKIKGSPPRNPQTFRESSYQKRGYLWQRGMDSIHHVHVNTDTLSHQKNSPEKCPQTVEKGKNWKYLEAFLRQRRHLSPFVVSMDSLLGMEAEATLYTHIQPPCNEVEAALL